MLGHVIHDNQKGWCIYDCAGNLLYSNFPSYDAAYKYMTKK